MKITTIRKFIAGSITSTAVAATALGSVAVSANEYKHVAVSPQQIHAQKMPAAQSKGIFSHSTMLPIYASSLSAVAGKSRASGLQQLELEQKILIDGPMDSPMVLLTPDAEQWFFSVTNPKGQMVYNELSGVVNSLEVSNIKMGSQSFKGKTLSLNNPLSGQWTIKLTRKGAAKSAAKMAAVNPQEVAAYSYLDNNFTTQNNDINVIAQVTDTTLNRGERSLMVKKEALTNAIDSAIATIKSPSGKYHTVVLNDDGIKGDKIAGDGLFGGKVPTSEVGVYTNQVQIQGTHADGKRFSRTTTDIYPIAAKSFAFADKPAQLKQLDKTSALLSVPVKNLNNSDEVFMSAEIWGTNADGKQRSAAWAGGIVTPKDSKTNTVLELNFDTRWLTRENLVGPYTLKSVRLQTVNGNVPLVQRDEMSLKSLAPIKMPVQLLGEQAISQAITPDMLMGKAPTRIINNTDDLVGSEAVAAGGPALLLVHGYCSGQAWKESHFSNAAEFQDYNKSISHNTFAQRVASFGNSYSSYGIVAHSQGGAAALELYTKYWSGLDNASGGRLIQSVGTPYQGTALAGNLAAIGDVFGAGCGTNTDLTYNGASNWLATIPSWARNAVDYYTTSFTDNWWSYDYCHLATDLFLNDPEDGTTEKWSGQLSGGVNKGHKTGQCHTSGMRDARQTHDTSRNSSMSSRAAR
jgi:pimeloyl-ACP methyl ester carboxylesterase